MRTVLLTGFEPFGGDDRNPSQEIAQALDGCRLPGCVVVGSVLPCVFGDSLGRLRQLIRAHRPEITLCLGLAGGRAEITPERIAINLDDARMADNAGAQPVDRAVVRRGPAAYFSTLPVKAIVGRLRQEGIPAAVSHSAGTFVCNHVFYGLMHALRKLEGARGGFIHVPYGAEHAAPGVPSLPLRTMIEAVALAIEVSVRTRRDPRVAEGTIA